MTKVLKLPSQHVGNGAPCWCGAEWIRVTDTEGRAGVVLFHNDEIGAAFQTHPREVLWYTPRETLL